MENNFISNYLLYSSANEAPPMFHVWCGYGVISAAVGRRVWLCHGENAIYGNIYTLLVGSAGCGKSTALSKARRMIAELGNVQCTYSVETVEGLIQVLGGDPKAKTPSECCTPMVWPDGVTRDTHQIVITANEFVDMIRVAPDTWTGFLNNIYDEDYYSYRTKNSGSQMLEGPYIVLLGAIPTEISKKLQEADIITTGLARRTIFQYGERQYAQPCPFPEFEIEHKDARAECVTRLKRIQQFQGEIKLSPAAREWWSTWYCEHSVAIPKKATPMTLGWLSSKPVQVQKLAILNCLATSDLMIIEPEHFQLGLEWLNKMEETLHYVFGGSGRNDLARVILAIEAYLTKQTEPVSYKKLKTVFFTQFSNGRQDDELRQCLEQLYAEGKAKNATITVGNISAEVIAKDEATIRSFASKVSMTPQPNVDVPREKAPDAPGQSGP